MKHRSYYLFHFIIIVAVNIVPGMAHSVVIQAGLSTLADSYMSNGVHQHTFDINGYLDHSEYSAPYVVKQATLEFSFVDDSQDDPGRVDITYGDWVRHDDHYYSYPNSGMAYYRLGTETSELEGESAIVSIGGKEVIVADESRSEIYYSGPNWDTVFDPDLHIRGFSYEYRNDFLVVDHRNERNECTWLYKYWYLATCSNDTYFNHIATFVGVDNYILGNTYSYLLSDSEMAVLSGSGFLDVSINVTGDLEIDRAILHVDLSPSLSETPSSVSAPSITYLLVPGLLGLLGINRQRNNEVGD